MDCVLGLDIGTTSTTGILISLPDRVLAETSRPVDLYSVEQGWAEEDPEDWWSNVQAIVPELIAKAGVAPEDIKGVGVSGMLPALVALDAEDNIVRRSIQQSDARNGAEVAEIASEFDESAFVAKTGNGINQQLIAAKLRWLERYEPEVFAKIATVFGSYDFINWKLTGVKSVDRNWALEAGFTDLATGELDPDLISLGHVHRETIPPIVASHAVTGFVTEAAAAATGLPAGIPVAGGAADHIASGFAAGVTRPGDVLLKFGGAADILIATRDARPDPRMFLDIHLVPDLYMPNGCMASGGSALNWFAERIAHGEQPAANAAGLSIHEHLDQIAADVPPGADGVLIVPYFLGEKTPIHDPSARGTIDGLSLNHDLRHMWRALLEGFAYAFRHHVEVFTDMGHPSQRFFASDGGSKSRLWMQICADVLHAKVQLLTGHPGSCLGAAWVGAIAAGVTDDWNGVSRFVSYGDVIEPRPENAALYDRGYDRFRTTYEAMRHVR